MSKLLKVITNELETKRFSLEIELERVLNSTTISMDDKKAQAIELLKEFAIAEISTNVWNIFTTPQEPAEGEAEAVEQKEDK
jgi:hypothetical protein